MRAKLVATLTVLLVLVLIFVGQIAYNSWRQSKLKEVHAGMTKSQVTEILGAPDEGRSGALSIGGSDCSTWKLIGDSFLEVCYDARGRVEKAEQYSIWY